MWDIVKTAAAAVFDAVKWYVEAYFSFWASVPGRIAAVASTMWDIVKIAAAAVFDVVKGYVEAYFSFWAGVPGRIADVAGTMWDIVKIAAAAVWNSVMAGVEAFIGYWTRLPGRVITVASGMWDIVKTAAAAAWSAVTSGVETFIGFWTGVPGRLSRLAGGMFDGIKEAFRSAINWVIRGWNRLEFRIPGFKIGPIGYDGFTLGVPDIPLLAKGGRAVSAGLALVGEAGPEIISMPTGASVVPLPAPTSAGIRESGVTVTVNVAGSVLSDQELAAVVLQYIRYGERVGFGGV